MIPGQGFYKSDTSFLHLVEAFAIGIHEIRIHFMLWYMFLGPFLFSFTIMNSSKIVSGSKKRYSLKIQVYKTLVENNHMELLAIFNASEDGLPLTKWPVIWKNAKSLILAVYNLSLTTPPIRNYLWKDPAKILVNNLCFKYHIRYVTKSLDTFCGLQFNIREMFRNIIGKTNHNIWFDGLWWYRED